MLELLKDSNFWTGSIVGIIIFKILDTLFSSVIDRIFGSLRIKTFGSLRLLFKLKTIYIPFKLTNISQKQLNTFKLGINHIRYGNDSFIANTAIDREKEEMNLLNRISYLKYKYNEKNKEINIRIPIKLHKVFGTQFKLLLDLENNASIEEIEEMLSQQNSISEYNRTASGRNRIYILLDEYPVVEDINKNNNNFIYPE